MSACGVGCYATNVCGGTLTATKIRSTGIVITKPFPLSKATTLIKAFRTCRGLAKGRLSRSIISTTVSRLIAAKSLRRDVSNSSGSIRTVVTSLGKRVTDKGVGAPRRVRRTVRGLTSGCSLGLSSSSGRGLLNLVGGLRKLSLG